MLPPAFNYLTAAPIDGKEKVVHWQLNYPPLVPLITVLYAKLGDHKWWKWLFFNR
ncbi:hypothetical protein [Nostoc sp. CALU 1950]|uniref:hypothetical protein n=1 Tax=Nostoc sp. CALU 1950 TaxID=3104321 RepID=UPI003EB7F9FC